MHHILGYRFRRTSLMLICYIAFLIGIGLAHAGYMVNLASCGLLACAVLLVWRRHTVIAVILIILCGVSFGLWRGNLYMQKLAVYNMLFHQEVTLTAQAIDDGAYNAHSQISFDAGNVELEDGQKLTGKIEVSGFGVNAVYQGDEVEVSGKLYPGYGAYQGRISFAKLELVQHHPSLIADIRRRFAAGMQSALPEPLAPFAMGLLIGQRATLPENVKQDLLMVGLTHIIAVSGYNLTIMLHASRQLFARQSKRINTGFSLILIAVFLLLAGASASIVRAAIVSVLSILTSYYGRSVKPLNLITLAAVITAWANPFYVWSDTSWYLSFLAFFGVMVLAPLLDERLPTRWRGSLIVAVALESICAETMTLPFVLHTFGQMSFIGLPANVLVVTLVPLAMLLSLFAGLAGMWATALAGWVAWPAMLLLTYMLDTAHLLAGLPHIFVENIDFSAGQMIAMYVLVAVMTVLLKYKTKLSESDTITDKKPQSNFMVRSEI